jgi:hypothetical protein
LAIISSKNIKDEVVQSANNAFESRLSMNRVPEETDNELDSDEQQKAPNSATGSPQNEIPKSANSKPTSAITAADQAANTEQTNGDNQPPETPVAPPPRTVMIFQFYRQNF